MPQRTRIKAVKAEPTMLANLRLEKSLHEDARNYALQRDETFSRLVRRLLRQEIYSSKEQA